MKKLYLAHSTQFDNIGNDGISEAVKMKAFTDKVAYYVRIGRGEIEIYQNNDNMGLMDYINHANSLDVDLCLDNHTNASDNQNVRGYEVYYSNYPSFSPESKRFADLLWNRITPITDVDRGVYPDTRLYGIGLAFCRETEAVACLHEIGFHTSTADQNELIQKQEQLAKATALAIYDYFGMSYYEPPVQTGKKYRVMCGSFNNRANALMRSKELADKGFESYIWEVDV